MREIFFMNCETGAMGITDNHTMRLSRLRRRVHAWGTGAKELLKDKKLTMAMIDLTYGPPSTWHKLDISQYRMALLDFLGDGCKGYGWVAEMQERGEVHYHILPIFERRLFIPTPDDSGMWVHGMSGIQRNIRTPFYLMKYVSKSKQKEGLPKGCRAYGLWLNKKMLSDDVILTFRMSALPGWLVEKAGSLIKEKGKMPVRLDGGGWGLGDQRFYSPYYVALGEREDV